MMHSEVRPAALEVLDLKEEEISDFLRGLIASKRLTPLVQTLNRDLLEGSAELAEAARTALKRLGFIDDPI